MAEFERDKLDHFLGVVRKYMQVRGAMSQKELAVLTEIGVSTMSRFLSGKTMEISPQLIAKIVAKLDIPLHEMIDFVEEEFADRFIRLVKFYKNELGGEEMKDDVAPPLATSEGKEREREKSPLRDKLEALSPRQKTFLTNFLDLDVEGKDLLVDVGNALFNYFRQKGM